MYGLKNVRSRRDDALTRVGWEQFESLLATNYRGQGYQVEHVGTGGTRARFDGGIDLKLRKGDQYILVQCKHWNAKQVPHNDVHQLLGIMVNEGATGAILISSGEFTKAAIEAATRQGHVQLIDGDELRAMLGAVAEPMDRRTAASSHVSDYASSLRGVTEAVGERLISAAEDRIRHGSGRRERGARNVVFWAVPLKLAFAVLMLWFFSRMIGSALEPLLHPRPLAPAPTAQTLPTPLPPPQGYVAHAAGASPDLPYEAVQPAPTFHQPTNAEIRQAQREADEAMKVIKDSTPEM